jgi:hypothetical protein
MKVLGVAVVVAWAAAACTSDSDALSSKQMSAADVRYDNGGAGLVSTNVQDAIDDVVAMAQATDERMQVQTIVCRFQTNSLAVKYVGTNAHVFTALECGGTLPGPAYVGTFAKLATCAAGFKTMQVSNAGEPDGPGVVLKEAANYYNCDGPADILVVFHKVQ